MASLVIFFGLTMVTSYRSNRLIYPDTKLIAVIFIAFILVHLFLRYLMPKADSLILPTTLLLSSLGLVIIFRLNESLFEYQFTWLIVGLIVMLLLIAFFRNYQALRNYKYIAALLGLVLFLAPIIFGTEKFGAKLWINIGGFSFQPAEVGKILLIIFFAAYLEDRREVLSISNKSFLRVQIPPLRHLGPLLVIWAISLVILIFEKDLGSSLLFMGNFIILLFIATNRLFYLISGTTFFMAGAAICYQIFPHVQNRVNIWLNPWADLSGRGYQIGQSLFAIANGGLTGTGLNQGFPETIPAATTDFIFSVIGEELGLIGGFAIIILYLILFLRGVSIALSCKSNFGKLMAAGLSFSIAFQTFIILGGVTKLIPLTGITLPFVSYGGSSLISNFILIGFLLVISEDVEKVA